MKYYIFRNSTIEPLFKGIDAEFSSYDDISLPKQKKECYVWFYTLPFENDIDNLVNIINSYFEKLKFLISHLNENDRILITSLEHIFYVPHQLSDNRLTNKICEFNNLIRDLDQKSDNIKILDLSEFIRKHSGFEIIDYKYYYLYACAINPKLNTNFILWLKQQENAFNYHRKKCIIIDLDNTIWDGIIGEDGVDGIKLGGAYPGNAYLDFQKGLITLQKEGVLLAICSKNNESDMIELWEKNKNMKIQPEHIITQRINWKNKHENILDIAQELNIGLESIVFIDDNLTERELIKQNLPDINVPDFPDEPYKLKSFFNKLYEEYFLAYKLIDEDSQKTEQYRIRKSANSEYSQFIDYEEFLKNLQLQVEIFSTDNSNIARISQMTQKTNQFNLTTKRYTESDLKNFLALGWDIFSISVSDKYGDYGITGCAIISKNNDIANIDSFLISCRIIGKGIESVMLYSILDELKKDGIRKVEASFIPSAKNTQTEYFYDNHDFILTKQTESEKQYEIELSKSFIIKDYYTIVRNT